MAQGWHVVENLDAILSPALLVYPDRVQENLRRIIEYAGGTARLRPHVKTHKMAEVIQLQMDAGIDKFKCATIAEAEMIAVAGGRDVMLAYQLVGPHVARMVRLAQAFPETAFSTMVDDAHSANALSAAMSQAGLAIQVLLDVNNGMGRSGIRPGAEAEELYRLLDSLPGLIPGGLHVYDGHIKQRELSERRAQVQRDFEAVDRLRDRLEAAGLPVPRVVAGGTPTFPIHAQRDDVECSPGTCVFWDAGYGGKFPDLRFQYAALLLTRVVSKPAGNRLCLDLGYKAVAPDNPDPRVVLIGIEQAQTIVHNEEHLTIETPRASSFEVGDTLYGVPYHVCPTVALHREAITIRNHRADGSWRVAARDRSLTI
jgi:D-serine deaminase-like pyridoxal phosphate-dependent protein